MKHIVFLILAIGIFFSCKNIQKQEVAKNQQPAKELTKLEQLYLLPKDSVYEFYDLSNDSIKEFPNLSEYSIKKLDLSHNQIDSLVQNRLPKGIEKLNLSNNFLSDYFRFEKMESLKELNISHNKISYFYGTISIKNNNKKYLEQSPVKRLNIRNNDLEHISFGGNNMNFLDISNNPKLSNEVFFDPKYVDTIIRDNIANKKPLIYYFHRSFTID